MKLSVGLFFCLLLLNTGTGLSKTKSITLAYVGLKGGVRLGFLGPNGGLDLREFGLGKGNYLAIDGVRMAMDETKKLSKYYKTKFELSDHQVNNSREAISRINKLQSEGVYLFILDFPGSMMKKISFESRNKDILLFNISAIDDELRQQDCSKNLFHILPSRAMLADGLAQYLLKRGWNKWLLVAGPKENDRAFQKAIERSSHRYGAKLVDIRIWKDNADMRRTAEAEFPVFTSRAQYDVVVVADEAAEFGELLPFHTYLPRPVVGTQGLSPKAWFWAFSQWGATQLNNRFIRKTQRKMTSTDWAGWMAVSIITQGATRGKALNPNMMKKYLANKGTSFHGYKGPSLSFRLWNQQLRQNILLTTPHARVSVSPQKGFMHPTSKLDTLGFDQAETQCQM